jgi:N-acetylmuramoyl-L-alanine amidase
MILFVIILSYNSFLSAQITTTNKIQTIVIDPGHGGKDPGTMGTKRYNIYEKHVALLVSLKLGQYISEAFPEIKIIYTRDEDIFLELNQRTDIANDSNADLFISIHCDGFTNSEAYGASVFVMGMSKLKANLDVAMRENSAIYMEDNYQQKYEGFDPKTPESYIVFSLMQNTYLDQSLLLAEEVEREFATKSNRKSRGVKQAPFYVISRTNMPSILIECGFLTNPKEEDFLHSDNGQDYLASAIFKAFRAYKLSVENVDDLNEDIPLVIISSDEKDKIDTNSLEQEEKEQVVFKVQIGTYLKSMKNDQFFIEIEAKELYLNGTFKYYVGAENKKSDADKIKIKMLNLGFNGAFVTAFYEDTRISMKEALDLQAKIKNNE